MGIFTRLTVNVIRKAHAGSSYFGACDYCTLPVSETFIGNQYPVYKKNAQDVYYLGGSIGGGTYGHEKCVRGLYSNAIDDSLISRDANIRVLPMTDIREIMSAGNVVGNGHPFFSDMRDPA
jgi:hypothetical protein